MQRFCLVNPTDSKKERLKKKNTCVSCILEIVSGREGVITEAQGLPPDGASLIIRP